MIMSDMYDNLEREGQGVSFVTTPWTATSVLVLKGNPKGVSNLDSSPARRSPARAAPRSRSSSRPQCEVQE